MDAKREIAHRAHCRPLWRSVLSMGLAAGAVVILVLALASPALAPPPGFPDVPADHPYHDAISDLAGRGIINGFVGGTFEPGAPVSRQQFAKMIVLTAGYPVSEADVCPFTDVEDSGPSALYPDNYVAVAAAHGITNGVGGGLFEPHKSVSHYQAVTMVVRTADALAPGLLVTPPASFEGAANWGDSSTHSPNAVRAEYNGLLGGLPLASLDPWGNMSRGEVAQVLHNLLGKLPSATTTTTAAPSTTTPSTASTTTTTIPVSPLENLGGNCLYRPAAVSSEPDRMDVFVVGTDKALWTRVWNGSSWSPWASLGGSLTSAPTAVTLGSGRVHVFARGSDGAVWCRALTGTTWANWFSIGGTPAAGSSPAVVAYNGAQLDVFIRGTDDHIWHWATFGPRQLPWEDLGGHMTGNPAAVVRVTEGLDVLARGTDGKLWRKVWSGGWSTWQIPGTALIESSPAAVAWAPDRLDIYARRVAGDKRLYKIEWDGFQGSKWIEQMSGPVCDMLGDPTVASWGWGRSDIFVQGIDGNLWHYAWAGSGGWIMGGSTDGPHAPLLEGGPITSSPVAISWKKGRIDVFALGHGGALVHKVYVTTVP